MTTSNIYLSDLSFNNTHISPTDFFQLHTCYIYFTKRGKTQPKTKTQTHYHPYDTDTKTNTHT